MRSWSIKTVVVAFSITITLAAAAPRAKAKSSTPSRSQIGVVGRFQQAASQLLKRFGIGSTGLPGDPWPCPPGDVCSDGFALSATDTTTRTASPKKQK